MSSLFLQSCVSVLRQLVCCTALLTLAHAACTHSDPVTATRDALLRQSEMLGAIRDQVRFCALVFAR